MKLYSKSQPAIQRRKAALQRLENQLQSGMKETSWKTKGEDLDKKSIPLTEGDKKRIEKEISVLQSRI